MGRPRLWKAALVASGLLLSLAFVELALRIGGFASEAERENSPGLGDRAAACTKLDQLFPHPYLEYVYHNNAPCDHAAVAPSGLPSPEIPAERDEEYYSVMLTGGSLAALLGGLRIANSGEWLPPSESRPRFLEEELARCYEAPQGRAFRVFNVAVGGWKQPQQAIALLLFGDAVDAVVSLEGFNEVHAYGFQRLETPHLSFQVLNPLATGTARFAGQGWLLALVQSTAERTWLRHSALVDVVLETWRTRLAEEAKRHGENLKTTSASLFRLPSDWPADRRRAFNIAAHMKYLRVMDSIADALGIPAMFFLQPVPAVGKQLTPQELEVVGDLSYRDTYLETEAALDDLRQDGVAAESLTQIFSRVDETVYADPAHLALAPDGLDSPGYRLLAAAIADRLAAKLGWTKICEREGPEHLRP